MLCRKHLSFKVSAYGKKEKFKSILTDVNESQWKKEDRNAVKSGKRIGGKRDSKMCERHWWIWKENKKGEDE